MANPTYQSGFYAPGRGTALHPELWDGCVGAWNPGLGNTGLALRDWSGLGWHGTLTNMDAGADWVVSDGRYALDFDGTNDYCTISGYTPLSTTQPFSVSAWIRHEAFSGTRYPVIVGLRTDSGPFQFQVSNDASYLGMLMGSSNLGWGRWRNGLAASTWVQTWRHVCYQYTGTGPTTLSSFKSWLDGQEIALLSAPSFGGTPSAYSYIGYGGGTSAQMMEGQLDDLRVYKKMLSPVEIKQLASRRGIAYELAPRKFYSLPAAAASSRQYRLFRPSILRGA